MHRYEDDLLHLEKFRLHVFTEANRLIDEHGGLVSMAQLCQHCSIGIDFATWLLEPHMDTLQLDPTNSTKLLLILLTYILLQ